jgi:hypothetical protein
MYETMRPKQMYAESNVRERVDERVVLSVEQADG